MWRSFTSYIVIPTIFLWEICGGRLLAFVVILLYTTSFFLSRQNIRHCRRTNINLTFFKITHRVVQLAYLSWPRLVTESQRQGQLQRRMLGTTTKETAMIREEDMIYFRCIKSIIIPIVIFIINIICLYLLFFSNSPSTNSWIIIGVVLIYLYFFSLLLLLYCYCRIVAFTVAAIVVSFFFFFCVVVVVLLSSAISSFFSLYVFSSSSTSSSCSPLPHWQLVFFFFY